MRNFKLQFLGGMMNLIQPGPSIRWQATREGGRVNPQKEGTGMTGGGRLSSREHLLHRLGDTG